MAKNPYGKHGDDAPIVTVDVVVFTLEHGILKTLVQPRAKAPDLGVDGLIGGWIHTSEDKTLEDTVRRNLSQKAGLDDVYFEQVKTVSSDTRHPEGWSLSVVYMAILHTDTLRPAFDRGCRLVPAEDPGRLALDHNDILKVALERLRSKGAYSTIPMEFLPEEFAMRQLHRTYEAVMGTKTDEGTFRRRVVELGLVEKTGRKARGEGTERAAALYRATEPRTFDKVFRPVGVRNG